MTRSDIGSNPTAQLYDYIVSYIISITVLLRRMSISGPFASHTSYRSKKTKHFPFTTNTPLLFQFGMHCRTVAGKLQHLLEILSGFFHVHVHRHVCACLVDCAYPWKFRRPADLANWDRAYQKASVFSSLSYPDLGLDLPFHTREL